MKTSLSADRRVWFEPPAFAAGESKDAASAWEDGVVDDAEGQWTRCAGPGIDLPTRAEEWSFDSVDSGHALIEAAR